MLKQDQQLYAHRGTQLSSKQYKNTVSINNLASTSSQINYL